MMGAQDAVGADTQTETETETQNKKPTHLQRAQKGRQHLAHGVGLAHRAAAPVELAKDVAAARVLGDQVDAEAVLKGGVELEHVRVVERAVDAHLAPHLFLFFLFGCCCVFC